MELEYLKKNDIQHDILLENDLNIINLLLQDGNKNYYYLIKKDDKKINIGSIAKQIDTSRLKLVESSVMEQLLDTKSGYVSVFCLLENKINNLTVLIDSRLNSQDDVTFYDLSKSRFIKLKYQDMMKYIASIDLPTYNVNL